MDEHIPLIMIYPTFKEIPKREMLDEVIAELKPSKVRTKIIAIRFSPDQISTGFEERLAYYQDCYGSIDPQDLKGNSLR